MATQIDLTYEDRDYCLAFSRQSVKTLEGQGFLMEEVGKKPMTMIPLLFYGAFFKNHRGIKRELVDEIFDNISDKSGLLTSLLEMYGETISSLTQEKGDSLGNAVWKVSR